MAFVGIDTSGSRELGQSLRHAADLADQLRREVAVALNLADVSSGAMLALTDVQDRLALVGAGLDGKADQAELRVFAAEPVDTVALAQTSARPPLHLPTTPEGAEQFREEVRARLALAPFEPIRFQDGNVSVVILKDPEGFSVVRGAGESLTGVAIGHDTPAFEAVVDAHFTEFHLGDAGVLLGGLQYYLWDGNVSPSLLQAEGLLVENGVIVTGRSSEDTFHLVRDPGDPDGAGSGGWRLGAGDPPTTSAFAYGGGVPVIVGGLPYGVINEYRDGAPTGLPETGDPGAENRGYLLQRSNKGFEMLEARGHDVGKVVTGLGPDGAVYVLVQRDGQDGPLMSELRESLVRMGVRDAVAWDGSGSATLVVDGKVEIAPEDIRDRAMTTGLGLRLPVSEQGLTNWVAGNELYAGTALTFSDPFEVPDTQWYEPWLTPVPTDVPDDFFASPDLVDWSDAASSMPAVGGFGPDAYDPVADTFSYYGGSPAHSAPLAMPDTWEFPTQDSYLSGSGATDFDSYDLDFSGYGFSEYDVFDNLDLGMDDLDFGGVDEYDWPDW